MIRLACPSCSKKLAVEDASAGTICKCPECDNKFRVPDAPPPEPAPATAVTAAKRSVSRDSARDSAARNSSTGSGARRDKGGAQAVTNGVVLDKLEVVDDEEPVRRKRRRKAPPPTWVYVAAAVIGVTWCALAPFAFLNKAMAVVLIVIGLPVSLTGRKWSIFGGVGLLYLLSGTGFFLLHNLSGPASGPPVASATPEQVDAHCARLLRNGTKVEAGSWVGVEKNTDSATILALRALIEDAYKHDAEKVWIVNPTKVDEGGLLSPDVVVVLPEDEQRREGTVAWYKKGINHRLAAGEKYLYVEY